MKKDMVQFFTWMRNGIAFCTSWFLILWLVGSYLLKVESIPTDSLIRMILFVIGGVFLFCIAFTRLFLKRWSFTKRLTCFMILFSVYESIVFYLSGLFTGGSFAKWICFIGIVMISYLGCIIIYHVYSKKQGELYTQALQRYQKKGTNIYD